jgi:hypothetical protein
MPTFFSTRVGDAFACVWKEEGEFASRAVYSLYREGLWHRHDRGCMGFQRGFHKCDNARLQLKKSKRITVRHFYSLVPMSVVSSPKATSKESSPGAPKVFR